MSLLVSTFYREPPREPDLIVGGGLSEVANRLIWVSLATLDHVTGLDNVTQMKVWGDVDPNFHPEMFGDNTGAYAEWVNYDAYFPVVLSAGNGAKVIHAIMRNASEVESDTLTATVTLNADPHPTVLWTDDQNIPPAGGMFQFGWSSSHTFDTAVIAQAPRDDATFDECEQLYETIGPITAGAMQIVNVRMPELAAQDLAPTQSGTKMLRIFISANGNWYSLPVVPEPFHVAVWDESVWDGDDRWE